MLLRRFVLVIKVIELCSPLYANLIGSTFENSETSVIVVGSAQTSIQLVQVLRRAASMCPEFANFM